MPRLHRPDLSLRPGWVMIIDNLGMAVSEGMAVRFRRFAALVLVLPTVVKCVQMFVPQRPVLVRKQLRIDKRP